MRNTKHKIRRTRKRKHVKKGGELDEIKMDDIKLEEEGNECTQTGPDPNDPKSNEPKPKIVSIETQNKLESGSTVISYLIKYSDGTYYEGNFKNKQREGKGTLFDKNNKVIYEGQWENDMKNGMGTYYYPLFYKIKKFNKKNMVSNIKLMEKYKNMKCGNVKIMYTGEWLDDIITGKGKMKYANGSYMDGNWLNNEPVGFIERTDEKGDVFKEDDDLLYYLHNDCIIL
jgi:hypothetical protein